MFRVLKCSACKIHWLESFSISRNDHSLSVAETTSAYSSLAARQTADSLRVGYPDTQDTIGTSTPDYLKRCDLSSRTSGTRMSLRSASRTLLAVPSTRTASASRAFSVCAQPGFETVYRNPRSPATVSKTFKTIGRKHLYLTALLNFAHDR